MQTGHDTTVHTVRKRRQWERFLPLLLLVLLPLLAGCLAKRPAPLATGELLVFGIALDDTTDYRVIGGVPATEEPCLHGYERQFEPLGITIGYDRDGRIRKLTTRNPATSICGIMPGMAADEGNRLALRAGFTATAPFRFQRESLALVLLVDATGTIFGVTLETGD